LPGEVHTVTKAKGSPSNLLGREIVKLDESCGRQMGMDDDVMLVMLGILQNVSDRAAYILKASAGTL